MYLCRRHGTVWKSDEGISRFLPQNSVPEQTRLMSIASVLGRVTASKGIPFKCCNVVQVTGKVRNHIQVDKSEFRYQTASRRPPDGRPFQTSKLPKVPKNRMYSTCSPMVGAHFLLLMAFILWAIRIYRHESPWPMAIASANANQLGSPRVCGLLRLLSVEAFPVTVERKPVSSQL